MSWDWRQLLQDVLPVVVAWLLGSLGIGYPIPKRIMNKEK